MMSHPLCALRHRYSRLLRTLMLQPSRPTLSIPTPVEDGIDVEQIRHMLSLSPDERLAVLESLQRLVLNARRDRAGT
jgi:hypothetical protein